MLRRLAIAAGLTLAAAQGNWAHAAEDPYQIGWICPGGFKPFTDVEMYLPTYMWENGPMRQRGCRIGFRIELKHRR